MMSQDMEVYIRKRRLAMKELYNDLKLQNLRIGHIEVRMAMRFNLTVHAVRKELRLLGLTTPKPVKRRKRNTKREKPITNTEGQ